MQFHVQLYDYLINNPRKENYCELSYDLYVFDMPSEFDGQMVIFTNIKSPVMLLI